MYASPSNSLQGDQSSTNLSATSQVPSRSWSSTRAARSVLGKNPQAPAA